jgi:subtilisin family serine protease
VDHMQLVRLRPLMELTRGMPGTIIGLIDGPVMTQHPALASDNIRTIRGICSELTSAACLHGTFVAGILSAKRDSIAPAICPDCTLLVRPIFAESTSGTEQVPSATPQELAAAVIECTEAGASVLNLSLGSAKLTTLEERDLEETLNYAARRGVIVVAAAGNQGTLGSSVITHHPWVIPVVACDQDGNPMDESNLGGSIGRRGLRAPGEKITSLGTEGKPLTLDGTSVAAPFVTGTIALLRSKIPKATAAEVKLAVTRVHAVGRRTVTPPLLDAWAAYQRLSTL